MSKGPIQSGEVIQIDWINFRRYVRNPKAGEVALIEFEVSQEDWQRLTTLPRDGMGSLEIVWTERSGWQEHEEGERSQTLAFRTPKKRAAKREPHGPYSPYWHSLMLQKFFEYAPVLNLMRRLKNRPEETDKQILQRLFVVDTRSDIAPDEFRVWLYEQLQARDLDEFQRKDLRRMFIVAEKKQELAQSEVVNG